MKKTLGMILLVLGVAVPILCNWTCSECGRDNWDDVTRCGWCRASR